MSQGDSETASIKSQADFVIPFETEEIQRVVAASLPLRAVSHEQAHMRLQTRGRLGALRDRSRLVAVERLRTPSGAARTPWQVGTSLGKESPGTPGAPLVAASAQACNVVPRDRNPIGRFAANTSQNIIYIEFLC